MDISGSFAITASGTATWADGRADGTPNGIFTGGACLQGNSGINVVASICHFALIGRLGTGGTPFLVGSSYGSDAGSGATGRLYLRINDTNTLDNIGYFTVSIIAIVDPCPNPTLLFADEPVVLADQPSGPGTEAKLFLKLFGIVASPTCSCNARARQMDEWGEYGCLKRIPEITGWLREESEKRGLWFFAPAGVALILLAISVAALKRLWKGNNK